MMKKASAHVIILNLCNKKRRIIWCMLTQLWSAADIIFCHFRPFLALLPHYWPRKIKIWKKFKKQSYDYMIPEIWSAPDRMFLSSWAIFCPFTLLLAWKMKISKKWKKHQEISSFYTSASKIKCIFKASTIKRLSQIPKCYCFSHSRASRIQKFFLPASEWPIIFFSVLWLLHFEIHFGGPEINIFIFDVIKNGQIFPSNVCHCQYDHRFIFSREACKEYVCKTVVNLDCRDSIRFTFFKLLYKKDYLERDFPFHFLQNILIETSNICFKNF